jgi:hypothetical protein
VFELGSTVYLGNQSEEHIKLSTSAVEVKGGSTVSASFGTDTTITGGSITLRSSANNNDKFILAADSAKFYDNGTDVASFGATSRIGALASEHVTITGTGMRVMDGTAHRATFGSDAHINGGTIYVGVTGSSGDWVQIDSTDIDIYRNNVSVGNFADTSFRVGALASEHITIDGGGMRVHDGATTIATFGSNVHLNDGQIYVGVTGSSGDWVEIDSSGIDIMRNNVSVGSFADSTVRVGIDDDDKSFVQIDADSMDFITDSGGTNTTRASFGATSVIGSSTDKVTISDSGITIRENNKDVITMASDVITVGSSTDQVEINGTSGITIRENNVDTIQLASGAVIVGEVGASKSNVQITSGAINLRTNTTNKMVLGTDGSITIGSNFAVNSPVNVISPPEVTAKLLPIVILPSVPSTILFVVLVLKLIAPLVI